MSVVSSQGFVNFAQPVIDKHDLERISQGLQPASYSYDFNQKRELLTPALGVGVGNSFSLNNNYHQSYVDDFDSLDSSNFLDLTIGHLTYSKTNAYVALHNFADSVLKNWYRPAGDWVCSDYDFVAKIQPLKAGGYEVVLIPVDMERLGNRISSDDRPRGKRVESDAVKNENDLITSCQRSKKKMRLLVKSMGCDRLLTLTKREAADTQYWTKEDWAAAWDKFRRLCAKAGVDLLYVAVLEPHKKGNFHLHAAVNGYLPINTLRGIWLACCGNGVKGSGNVDVKYRQDLSEDKRRSGVAKYISKYISKLIDSVDFNKKRYWASRHTLEAVKRVILKACDFNSAFLELAALLGLDVDVLRDEAFLFPDGSGCWFSFEPELAKEVPF
jgi:hypothetical protein